MNSRLSLIRRERNAEYPADMAVDQLVIAGWTGRDPDIVEKHIQELAALGVARPKRTPLFYRVSASLLTTGDEIQVVGGNSSGEVEFVLFGMGDGLLLGVGSDHTDRVIEATGVTISKQMCAKPVGLHVWPFVDVAGHWDRLILRSFAHRRKLRRLYQEGSVSAIRSPEELMRLYIGETPALPRGTAMFCGTLPVHGAVESADEFEIELIDPVLDRTLMHRYRVAQLPIEG